MLNKSAARELRTISPAVVTPEVKTEAVWLWAPLTIHAIIMAWLISLIF